MQTHLIQQQARFSCETTIHYCFHPESIYAKLSTRGWKLAGVVLLMGTASVFWEINQHVAGYSLEHEIEPLV